MIPTIGSRARLAVTAGQFGRVVAVFPRAIYVRFAGAVGVVALTSIDAPSGPLHMRVTELPKACVGDTVVWHGDSLLVGVHRLGIPAQEWAPTPVDQLIERRATAVRVLRDVLGTTRMLDLDGRPWNVRGDLRRHGLRMAIAHLAGRGAGLTPAGDDCAGGILFVTALLREAGLSTWSSSALVELASGHASHEIAVAFLVEAARGECIEPLHELLGSSALGDRREAAHTMCILDRIGHTSGRDMAFGMLVGLELADVIAGDWRVDRDHVNSASHSPTYTATMR